MTTAFQPQTAARRHVSLVYPASLRPIDREQPGRRVLNIVAALAGIVLALPLMLVIAALVKLTSRGPVLFRQTRIGLDRRSLARAGWNTRRRLDIGAAPVTIYQVPTMQVAPDKC